MSFEKINLPDLLLADLYKDGLVVIDNEVDTKKKANKKPEPVEKEEVILVNKTVDTYSDNDVSKPLTYLGSNNRNISIVVNDAEALHLQDEYLDILSAILGACKLNLADVAIINNHHQQVTDAILRKELQPSSVILFGVETSAAGLPFSIPDYKVQQFNNCSYLQVASLEKMKGSSTEAKLEKSKLWVCLKSLFGV